MSTITTNFVNFLYQEFLGRSPSETAGDLAGRNFWVNQIDNTPTTSAEATVIFLNNPEFDAVVAPIARLYQASFDRVFDSAGLMFWTGIYRSGATLTQIGQEFLVSPEFTQVNGDINSLTNQQYVELLYRNVLGREGETSGVQFWTGQLASGALSRADVLVAFSESDENISNTASQIDVSLAYEALAGRPPTGAELAAGIALYESGLTGAVSFIESLLLSPAYAGPPAPGYIAPDAVNDAFTVTAGQTLALPVLANDVDPDGGLLKISAVTQPTKGGTVAISADGQNVLFTAAENVKDSTTATFTYTVKDDKGLSDTATVTVTIPRQEVAPVANPDTAATARRTPITINVLANDTDANGDTLSLVRVQSPDASIGTTAIVGDQIRFTPSVTFIGQTSFTYVVTDGVFERTGTVTVDVTNAAPVATNDSATTTVARPVLVPVLANDTDANNDALTIDTLSTPTRGTVQIINSQVLYTPTSRFVGTDTFTYTVTDGNLRSNQATVTITVENQAPIAVSDTAATDSTQPVFINVLANDRDPDDDALTIDSVGSPANGTAVIQSGQILYTPQAGFSGTDTFNYTIRDAFGALSTAQVSVLVNNRAPSAQNDLAVTVEGEPVLVDVLANDSDPDGHPLTLTGVTQPTTGGRVEILDNQALFTPNVGFTGQTTFKYTVSDGQGGSATATATVVVSDLAALVTTEDRKIGGQLNPIGANDFTTVTNPLAGTLSLNAQGQFTFDPTGAFDFLMAGESTIVSFKYSYTSPTTGNLVTREQVVLIEGVNDAPLAPVQTVNVIAGRQIDMAALNVSDVEGDMLSVSLRPGFGTKNGALTTHFDVGNQAFHYSYTPNAGFVGTDSFQYLVSDGQAITFSAVNINVTNSGPTAVADAGQVHNGNALTFNVLANDSDPDNHALSVVGFTQPAFGGSVSQVGNTLVFKASPDRPAVLDPVTAGPGESTRFTTSFTYTINDGYNKTSDGSPTTATATVTVEVVDTQPTFPYQDIGETRGDPLNPVGGPVTRVLRLERDVSTLTFNLAELVNDADGDTLSFSKLTAIGAPNGLAVLSTGGLLEYTPDVDFFGYDDFTFTVDDGRGGNGALSFNIRFVVTAADTLAVNGKFAGNEDAPFSLNMNNLVVGQFDGPVSFTITSALPARGDLSVSPNGILTFDPNGQFEELNVGNAETFTVDYRVQDVWGSHGLGTVTFTVTGVNDNPTAQDLDGGDMVGGYAVNAGREAMNTYFGTFHTTDLVADIDDAFDTLSFVTEIGFTANGGSYFINGDGTFGYSPAFGFTGVDSFGYTVLDPQGGAAMATFTINVTNEPMSVEDDGDDIFEQAAFTITHGDGDEAPEIFDVLRNDSSGDVGQGLFILEVSAVSNNAGTVEITEDGRFVSFTATPGYQGPAFFTYTASDGVTTQTAQVSVTVLLDNVNPSATDDFALTRTGTPILIDVTANDFDINGNPISVFSIDATGTNGTVEQLGNQVLFTPNVGFTGVTSFSYTLTDGRGGFDTATVTVLVSDEVNNIPPTVNNDSAVTRVGRAVTIDVLANDFDLNGDPIRIAGIGTVSNGVAEVLDSQIVFTPAAGFSGTTSFTYTVEDGRGGSATGTVTILVSDTVTNDPPTARNDSAVTRIGQPVIIDVLANDSDVNDDALEVIDLDVTGTEGTVELLNNQVVFTPNAGFSGVTTFTYTISDGRGGTATTSVAVLVSDQVTNNPPTARNDSAVTRIGQPVIIDVAGNDFDVDGDPISIVSVDGVANGTVEVLDGQIVFTPEAGFAGTTSFTYTISDGRGGLSTATVTVLVSDTVTNRPPVANDDSAFTTDGNAVVIPVLANDSDPDGDALTVSTAVTVTDGGAIAQVGNEVVFTPYLGFNGTTTFDYTIKDGRGGSDTASVTIAVKDDLTRTITEDQVFKALVKDGSTLVSAPADGQVTFEKGSTYLVFDPTQSKTLQALNVGQTDTIEITYNDGVDNIPVKLTVTGVNDAPVAADDQTDTTLAGNTLDAIVPMITDIDNFDSELFILGLVDDTTGGSLVTADAITVYAADGREAGTVIFNSGFGDFTYIPDGTNFDLATGDLTDPGFVGTFSFRYLVEDIYGGADFGTITITVTNEHPVTKTDVTNVSTGDLKFADNQIKLGGTIAFDVLANDFDPDNDTLPAVPHVVTLVDFDETTDLGTITRVGDNLVFTSNGKGLGTTTFTYTVSDGYDNDGDGLADTVTQTITVEVIDRAPTFEFGNLLDLIPGVGTPTKDTAVLRMEKNTTAMFDLDLDPMSKDGIVFDPDGHPLAITAIDPVLGIANGKALVNGIVLNYTPKVDFVGVEDFGLTVTDLVGGQSVDGRLRIVVMDEFVFDGNAGTTTEDKMLVSDLTKFVNLSVFDGPVNRFQILSEDTKGLGVLKLSETGVLTFNPDGDFEALNVGDVRTFTVNYRAQDFFGSYGDGTVTFTVTGVNDAPVITVKGNTLADTMVGGFDEVMPYAMNVYEGDFIQLAGGDISQLVSDVDNKLSTLKFVAEMGVTSNGGIYVINSDGTFTYTPAFGFAAVDSFTYTIIDPQGDTDTATFTIKVTDNPMTAENDPGNGFENAFTMTHGAGNELPQTFYPLVNDSSNDVGEQGLYITEINGMDVSKGQIVTITNAPGGTITVGTIKVDATGQGVIFTARPETETQTGYQGPVFFTYTASDGVTSVTKTVNADVLLDNVKPSAFNDVAITRVNQPTIIDLLANDFDADGNALTLIEINGKAVVIGAKVDVDKGTVEVLDGKVVFIPNLDFKGITTFEYTITDGKNADGKGESVDSATVTVLVSNTVTNNPPSAQNDSAITRVGQPVVIDVTANDFDINGDPIAITAIDGTAVMSGDKVTVDKGTVQVLGGQVVFTPNAGFEGTTTFTYTIGDGREGVDTATVTVLVSNAINNNPPTANNDSAVIRPGQSIALDVLANDFDIDGDSITITEIDGKALTGDWTAVTNGEVRVLDSQIVFKASTDTMERVATFTYTIDDGRGSPVSTDMATVTVLISNQVINTPPIAKDDLALTKNAVPVFINVLANDSDPDGDALTIVKINNQSVANLDLVFVDGGVLQVVDGQLYYLQNVGFTGASTFTYTISDGRAGGLATATVTVGAEQGDVIFTTEDDSFVGVLDQPGKGGVFSIVKDINPLTEGTIKLDSATGVFEFDPNGKSEFLNVGQTRELTFTYAVDGVVQDPITIIVKGVNDAPVATDQVLNTRVRTDLSGKVAVTDVDDLIFQVNNFRIINEPQNGTIADGIFGGTFKYTPNTNFTGTDTFTYVATDSQGATDVATVTINVINALPVAQNDTATVKISGTVNINVLANDADADFDRAPPDSLIITAVDGVTLIGGPVGVAGGTVSLVGNQLAFTSDGTAGDFSFNYTIQDEFGATDVGQVVVTVLPNLPPIANDDTAVTKQLVPITINVLANDTDPNGDTLSINDATVTVVNPAQGTAQVVTLGGVEQIQFTPAAGFAGTALVTYKATDGLLDSNVATVTITVNNIPPVAQDDQAKVAASQTVTIAVLANDSDAGGDTLTITEVNGNPLVGSVAVAGGSVVLVGDQLAFTSNGTVGNFTFNYGISDGNGGTASANVTVTVTGAAFQDVSVDGKGTQLNPAFFDAGTDSFRLIDTAPVANVVNVNNFGADDVIQYGAGIVANDVAVQSVGNDVILTLNVGGTLSQLTLVGVVTPNDLIFDVASFNALPVGDITFI